MVQTVVLDKFVCLVQALGLSDDNVVFPDLTGNGPSGGRRGLHPARARPWPSRALWEPMGECGLRAGSTCGVLATPEGSAGAQRGFLTTPWSLSPPGVPLSQATPCPHLGSRIPGRLLSFQEHFPRV